MTIGTIGYGDVVPVTTLGKLIATGTIFVGLVMMALPVGIIATAFADEIKGKKEPLRLGVGRFFGEVAVLRRARRSATATALARTNLLVLDAQDLHALMQRDPRIAARIKDVVEKRVGREVVSPRGDIVEEEIK